MDAETTGIIIIVASIAGLVLLILSILVPVNVYLAQRNAYKCSVELKTVNKQLKAVTSQLNAANESMAFLAEVEAKRLSEGRAREAGA